MGLIGALAIVATLAVGGGSAGAQAPVCAPGGPPVSLSGSVTANQARSYQVFGFEVAGGTTRVEVTYGWSDLLRELGIPGNPVTGLVQTVFDAGLWDQRGYRSADGFRGWSGSRVGRVADGQPPIFVQQDTAARGYRPGPIEPGIWWFDLGIAAVFPAGADWHATITCTDPEVGPPFEQSRMNPDTVLDPEPGWYHADLHVHAVHSSNSAPGWDDIVEQARVAGLEVLPVTEYVTGQHWDELGEVQERNPDILIWPGREIITYFGHAIALGETPSVLEYRHGFEDVTLADIQAETLAGGALFSVAHPTIFPGPVFRNLCRGCEFELDSVIDWSGVDAVEVLTGPALATGSDLGIPDLGFQIANPFLRTAIDYWERHLLAGHRITAVSGSDSKANEGDAAERRRAGIGSSATAIYADSLSRPALEEAVRAGRAYVRTLGPHRSPALEVVAKAPDGATAGMGEDLFSDRAELEVTVTGGEGDSLVLIRNGETFGAPVPVTSDPFTTTVSVSRDSATEGPLGSHVRVETIRPVEVAPGVSGPQEVNDLLAEAGLSLPAEVDVLRLPTTISNPVFLRGPADARVEISSIVVEPNSPDPTEPGVQVLGATGAANGGGPAGSGRLPATGGALAAQALAAALAMVAFGLALRGAGARRRRYFQSARVRVGAAPRSHTRRQRAASGP